MALHVDNLSLARGERTILRGLSLAVESGEALLLSGPNGAGKTTLLRAVAGLLVPASGSIRLDEHGLRLEAGEPIGAACHFVGHLNAIRPALTVAENAAFWAGYLGGSVAVVPEALDRFRLGDLAGIRAGYLSAGQKRRLGLCRLLLADRPLWLLDEPAVSLDAASQGLLADIVNRHLATGGMVLAATHQPLGFSPARELALGRPPPESTAAADRAGVDVETMGRGAEA